MFGVGDDWGWVVRSSLSFIVSGLGNKQEYKEDLCLVFKENKKFLLYQLMDVNDRLPTDFALSRIFILVGCSFICCVLLGVVVEIIFQLKFILTSFLITSLGPLH